MNYFKIKKSLLIVMIFFVTSVYAQDTYVSQDLEMWNSIAISKKFGDNWKVSLEEEFRFTEDVSRFDIFLTNAELSYKINKHFSAGVDYRFYKNKNKSSIFISQHRFAINASYKHKINRFTLEYKIQFQNKDEDFSLITSSNNINNLRNKISINYNIRKFKLDPYFQAELFRRYEAEIDSYFSKMRWTLGADYSFAKKSSIKLFYRLDNELNSVFAKNTFIIGLGYKYSF